MVTERVTETSAAWPASSTSLKAGRRFLLESARSEPVVVTFHGDVDGLSGGVLVVRALQRLGCRGVTPIPAGKGQHVHAAALLDRIRAHRPTALVVLDMGSRGEPILPGTPTLVIDHHQPRGFPPDAVVVSAFGHPPVAPTGLLAYTVASAAAPIRDLEWVALLGTVADLGPDAPFPEMRRLLKQCGRRNVTEAVALLNAAKRSAAHDADTAFSVLSRAQSPADIAAGRVEGVERLRAYRDEVNAEVARCSRTPPRFAGRLALLRFASPAQVHPLVAIRWARRLPSQIIIAANENYLPGRVNFALRTMSDVDLVQLLRNVRLDDVEGEYGYGHPKATGGSLSPEDFSRLLEALGF